MSTYLWLSLILAIVGSSSSAGDTYEEIWKDVFQMMQTNEKLKSEWDGKMANAYAYDSLPVIDFTCNVTKSKSIPKTVHELRPGDIKVIAAMGDSITAGNGLGAESEAEVVLQNRGESWSIGGDRSLEDGVITLANIIRKFNPDVKGFSVGRSWHMNRKAWLNAARAGHRSVHMPADAEYLIEQLKNNHIKKRIDFRKDWKLTTLLIGGNDICGYCKKRESRSPDKYVEYIRTALDLLQASVPRMLVQVVVMFDVSPIHYYQDGYLCSVLQERFCSCAVDETQRKELRPLQLGYYEKLQQLIGESGRYDDKDDFSVVLQPMFRDLKMPTDKNGNRDKSYLSYDCFHPARKMHQTMAYMLWNCMMIPVGLKPYQYGYHGNRQFTCPTEDSPFIYTNRNSGMMQRTAMNITAGLYSVKEPTSQMLDVKQQNGRQSTSFTVVLVGGAMFMLVAAISVFVAFNRRKHRRSELLCETRESEPTSYTNETRTVDVDN